VISGMVLLLKAKRNTSARHLASTLCWDRIMGDGMATKSVVTPALSYPTRRLLRNWIKGTKTTQTVPSMCSIMPPRCCTMFVAGVRRMSTRSMPRSTIVFRSQRCLTSWLTPSRYKTMTMRGPSRQLAGRESLVTLQIRNPSAARSTSSSRSLSRRSRIQNVTLCDASRQATL